MSEGRNFTAYEERLNRVMTHIYDNLGEELNLDRLAEIACMSPYHWHHVFRAMTGETLAEVVRRLRLNWAANVLLQGSDPVRSVAEQAGYTNLSSFSRAFKRTHGLSPDDFRKQGAKVTHLWEQNAMTDDAYPMIVREMDGFAAAGARHEGPYRQIGRAFKELGSVLIANSLMDAVDLLFCLYHDVPGTKPDEEMCSHVAVAIRESFPKDLEKLEYFDISGGRYAVLEHTGPYAMLKGAYEWLYGHWLPKSGFEPRDEPPLEVYINDPRQTPASELRTDIRLPLI